MSFVPIALGIALFGFMAMNTFISFNDGWIDTRTKRFGIIRRSEKPKVFWTIWIASLLVDVILAFLLIDWATSK